MRNATTVFLASTVLFMAAQGLSGEDAGKPAASPPVATARRGLEDLQLQVERRDRIAYLEEQTVVTVRLTNLGTAPAQGVKVKVKLTPNLEPLETAGTEDNAVVTADKVIEFPTIDRIEPNTVRQLRIALDAKKFGIAVVQVECTDEELAGALLTGSTSFHVRARSRLTLDN